MNKPITKKGLAAEPIVHRGPPFAKANKSEKSAKLDQPRPSPGDDGPRAAHPGYAQFGTKDQPKMQNAGGLKGRTAFTAKDLQQGHKKLGKVSVTESPTDRRSRDSNPNQDTITNKANK